MLTIFLRRRRKSQLENPGDAQQDSFSIKEEIDGSSSSKLVPTTDDTSASVTDRQSTDAVLGATIHGVEMQSIEMFEMKDPYLSQQGRKTPPVPGLTTLSPNSRFELPASPILRASSPGHFSRSMQYLKTNR